MVTSRDVAKSAGVSQATVSRALQNSDAVTPASRQRVLDAVERLGYRPNFVARAMRTQRTGTIGVVVDEITNPFYPHLLRALSAELDRFGLRMILWDSNGPGELGAVEAIEQRLVDGLVFTTATPKSAPLRRALERSAPLVLVNRIVHDIPCDRVDSDNAASSGRVAQYFVWNGRKRMALVGGPQEASTAKDRMRGFRQGLRKHGLVLPRENVVNGGFSHEGGAIALRRILASGPPPDAVFCVNDLSALGVLDEASAQGIRVPEEMWVVGFDDIEMAAWEAYSLTTMAQPVGDMARESVRLLLARIDDGTAQTVHRRLENQLVARRATAFASEEGAT